MKQIKNYYKVLGIGSDSSSEKIKTAYKELAKIYHPDRNPNSTFAAARFAEITEAYNVLGNLDNRLKYSILFNKSKALQEKIKLADYMVRNK